MSRPAWRTAAIARASPAAHEVDDVLAVVGGAATGPDPGGERRAGSHGFEATGVAAAAGDVVGADHADVTEVAGHTGGPALETAAGDDAGADAGGDLDQHQVVDVGQVHLLLAESHDVDVVVDQHGYGVLALETPRHVVLVPARHDRRADRAAGRVLDRAGQADADRGQVLERTALRLQQRAHGRGHPAQHHLGTLGHVEALAHLAEDLAGEVGQGGAHVGGADVDADHDLGRRVEREQRGRASAGRARAPERRHQLEAHQYVDPGGDGGPRQAGGVRELGARPRSAVAQQLEDVARVHGRSEAPRAFGV